MAYYTNGDTTIDAPVASTYKRIIVCCDGTWQDGLDARQNWKYTNILRLARSIDHVDKRFNPPIHQVVFYQSGIGTDNLYDKIVDGVTGATLAGKVEEAYGFIAHNYRPGDEIFLFGFSRGAYTARMVAMFIGAIGVLNRTHMDQFASIFLAYQKRGKAEDEEEKRQLDEELEPWTGPEGPGKKRVSVGAGHFSVKVVGVFDTVGSVGMPEELSLSNEKLKNIFGFPDKRLGHHIERAYQALAVNETRADFDCAKFEQTETGRRKGQILRQCWFTGSHCDIGGGFQEHDLSDITLNWMIANIGDTLAFDYDYVMSLPRPDTYWGEQPPHDPLTSFYKFAKVIQRTLPKQADNTTHEMIHSSVVGQKQLIPELKSVIDANPSLIEKLLPWEEQVKAMWDNKAQVHSTVASSEAVRPGHHHHASEFVDRAVGALKHLKHASRSDEHTSDDHHRAYVNTWLQKLASESSVGAVVQELLKK